jgi:hypothetical protein
MVEVKEDLHSLENGMEFAVRTLATSSVVKPVCGAPKPEAGVPEAHARQSGNAACAASKVILRSSPRMISGEFAAGRRTGS